MIAVLFRDKFKAPILSGQKTETRRLPCCRKCSSHVLLRAGGEELRCLVCGETSKVRWRVQVGAQFSAVERPLFAIPLPCPDDAEHGPMKRVKDRITNAVTGYWCEACGAGQPARFALLELQSRSLERLEEITEEGARVDGLCSRAEFLEMLLTFNGVQDYKPNGSTKKITTPTTIAVEVYRFRCVGP